MSKVILSKKTLDVLKNFSTINSSIVFRKGSTVRTISNAENILAKFTGEEVFPVDFAIYDLSQFLSGISLFSDPQLEFDNESFVSIRGGRQSARYYFSDPEITLKSAPEKNVNFPGADIQFLGGERLLCRLREQERLRRETDGAHARGQRLLRHSFGDSGLFPPGHYRECSGHRLGGGGFGFPRSVCMGTVQQEGQRGRGAFGGRCGSGNMPLSLPDRNTLAAGGYPGYDRFVAAGSGR